MPLSPPGARSETPLDGPAALETPHVVLLDFLESMAQVIPRGASSGADASASMYACASRLELYRSLPPLFGA